MELTCGPQFPLSEKQPRLPVPGRLLDSHLRLCRALSGLRAEALCLLHPSPQDRWLKSLASDSGSDVRWATAGLLGMALPWTRARNQSLSPV